MNINRLPAPLTDRLCGRNLIVFDGHCVLCSGFFRFVLRHDRRNRFRFATAQSSLGAELFRALDLPCEDFETNLVVLDGRIYQRLDAFAAAMAALGWPWRILALCRLIPEPLSSFLYHRIARNRYAIFGRTDTCLVPDAAVRARFLDA